MSWWRFWQRPDRPRPHYTAEATALFSQFAERRRLAHRVIDAPIEVLWEFPAQDGLSLPVTLGLQNNDELNFGVPGFWSYFFPFPKVASHFESILDAWVEGRAQIVRGAILNGRRLQLLTDGKWTTVYGAYGGGAWEHATNILQNDTRFRAPHLAETPRSGQFATSN